MPVDSYYVGEDFSVDYRLESKVSAYFNWYEDMVRLTPYIR